MQINYTSPFRAATLALLLLLPTLVLAQASKEVVSAHRAAAKLEPLLPLVPHYPLLSELPSLPYSLTQCATRGPRPVWGSKRLGTFLYQAGSMGKKVLNMTTIRVGLNLGATAPFGVPEGTTIRAFAPAFAPMLAIEQYIGFVSWMGCVTGLYAEYKGMKTNALVANFYTKVSLDNAKEPFAGYFTGTNKTEVNCAYLGIPLRLAFNITRRYQLQLGGYAAYALYKSFKGNVSDGYIWQVPNEPGGESKKTTVPDAPYDFSNDVQDFDAGLSLYGIHGLSKHLILSAGLTVSMLNLFKEDFEGVSMRMQHIYLNVAMGYCFTGLFKE